MAITVTPDLVTLADCDSNTGWTLGDVDVDLFVQGTACLGEQVKATTSALFTYTLPAAVDLTGGKHVYQWMFVAGAVDTKANGGYRIYLESSAGNDATWFVGGSDTVIGGWYCFVLDPSSTPDLQNGTIDLSSITKIGVQFKTVTSIAGTANNCFWDISRYGTGYNINSLSTDLITLEDIYAVDNAVSNKYGVLSLVNGVYYAKGAIRYGDNVSGDINADISGSLLVFTQDAVSGSLFSIATSGAVGSSSSLNISGSVIKAAGIKALIDLSDPDTTVTISGTTFTNTGYVLLNSNHSVSSSSFNICDAIKPDGATLSGVTISSTTEISTGAIEFLDIASINACSGLSFYDFALKTAVYIPATVTGTITLDNFVSDGSGTDVYWAGTSGTLIINNANGTNFSTYSSAGGLVEFQNYKTLSFDVYDSVGNALVDYEWRIYDNQGVQGEYGIEIAGEESSISSAQSYSYNYVSDDGVIIQIIKIGYVESITSATLINSDQNIKIILNKETN